MELLAAPGQQLVHVGLMAHVEDKVVRGRIEDVVHGDGKFDHAEVGTELAAGPCQHGDQFLANLCCQLFELRDGEAFDVGGGIDGLEYGTHGRRIQTNARYLENPFFQVDEAVGQAIRLDVRIILATEFALPERHPNIFQY